MQEKRAIGPITCARFGDVEPIGYMACWVLNRHRFPSKEKHMQYRPKASEIETYLLEQGLL